MPAQAAILHDTIVTRARKTAIRLAWDEETLGAAPRRATISFAPVAEQTTGIRLLNGTTQVQFLPGAIAAPAAMRRALRGFFAERFRAEHSSQRTECAARLLSGVSLVRCQGEEPFHKRSASGWSRTLI